MVLAGSRREQRRGAQRARITNAAVRLFSSRGFEDVTVAEIADAAGVARATVFNQFGSKRALVEAITEQVLEAYQALLRSALDDAGTPAPDLVRGLFDDIAMGIERDRSFYRGLFREIARVRLGLYEGGTGERAGREALALLVRLLARGQQRGELCEAFGAEPLASAFDSLVNGTITHWLYGDATDSLRERMRCAAEVFLGPVAVEQRRTT